MKFNILLVSISIFFACNIKLFAQSSNKEVSQIFKEAYLNAEAKNYQLAIEKYSKYIKLSSDIDSIAIGFLIEGIAIMLFLNFRIHMMILTQHLV